jgi:hypothetical protein
MADQWFSPGTPVFSTNKVDCHSIIEIIKLQTILADFTKICSISYIQVFLSFGLEMT